MIEGADLLQHLDKNENTHIIFVKIEEWEEGENASHFQTQQFLSPSFLL